jgi:hypothetical protein
LDSSQFEKLAPCDQVKLFSEVAGELVSQDNNGTGEPSWMHKSLMKMPRQTLNVCFTDEMEQIVFVIESSRDFNETAVKRLYALTFEANRLQIISEPIVLDVLGTAVCTPNADPFGNLAELYYFTVHGTMPTYLDHGLDSKDRLRNEICG